MKSRQGLVDERGQAATEFVIALTLLCVVLAAVGGLFSLFSRAGTDNSSFVGQSLSRAPYSLGSSAFGTVQGASDALMH
jgi:hypothetical protein